MPEGLPIRDWLEKVDVVMGEIEDSYCFSEHEEIF